MDLKFAKHTENTSRCTQLRDHDSQVAKDEIVLVYFGVPGTFYRARFVYSEVVILKLPENGAPRYGGHVQERSKTREERENNERTTREDFSQKHSFVALASPYVEVGINMRFDFWIRNMTEVQQIDLYRNGASRLKL